MATINKPVPAVITIDALSSSYRRADFTVAHVMQVMLSRIARTSPAEVWISMKSHQDILAQAVALDTAYAKDPVGTLTRYPLFGIPFAVKDNIDVRGLPTTAACPAFSFQPEQSAEVVLRLERAGAILVGKTNLDQFATGLVGTRSPYGAVKNPFNPAYISGGSSSGSAVAVALGFAAFSLGTDTAGSGRVPAGFCNLVGLKSTPGLISTRGVFPACRSLDCVSIFAHTVSDAWNVLHAVAGVDQEAAYSRAIEGLAPIARGIRIGIPDKLAFCGDDQAEAAFGRALALIGALPQVTLVPVDFAPLHDVAALLYDGPWVAERRAALDTFYDEHGTDMDPTVHDVIGRAENITAVDTFKAFYKLETGKNRAEKIFTQVDLLLTPTAPAHYTLAQIEAEPVKLNSNLGLYTNFVNLLDMSAIALPGCFREDGLPAGVTLIGPAGADHRLATFASQIAPLLHQRLGTTDQMPVHGAIPLPLPAHEPLARVIVVGAHLSGQPLNWQLVERSAVLVKRTRTSRNYRLFALPHTTPPKPGLLRVEGIDAGDAIEVEIWEMPGRHYGSFVAGIPSPLCIGTIELEDGSMEQGFICEAWATRDAKDITVMRSWREYVKSTEAIQT